MKTKTEAHRIVRAKIAEDPEIAATIGDIGLDVMACAVCFEQAMARMRELDLRVAGAHPDLFPGPEQVSVGALRVEIIKAIKEERIVEDELVADWHDAFSACIGWAEELGVI